MKNVIEKSEQISKILWCDNKVMLGVVDSYLRFGRFLVQVRSYILPIQPPTGHSERVIWIVGIIVHVVIRFVAIFNKIINKYTKIKPHIDEFCYNWNFAAAWWW